MRRLAIFLFACPAAIYAQSAESDSRTLQTLLTEVQQLRYAIERSTLLGARTQLAISQLQLQEGKVERLTRELTAVRDNISQQEMHKTRLANVIKEFEGRKTLPSYSTPQGQLEVDSQLKQFKAELEQWTADEQRRTAREGELASQLQTAQRDVQESRNWIAEMQRSLDAAIQQMLRPR